MTQYTTIKSRYIENLIQGTNWGRRGYIDDLIKLEYFILHGINHYTESVHYQFLKSRYRKEWETICGELNPERLKDELKWEEEQKKRCEEFKERKKKEEEEGRKDWIQAGGKI